MKKMKWNVICNEIMCEKKKIRKIVINNGRREKMKKWKKWRRKIVIVIVMKVMK